MASDSAEICLLWGEWQIQEWWSCMPRSEWSGWVQAFGSVLAIFVAIWISGYPLRAEKKNSVIQSRIAAKGIVDCVQGISYGLQKNVPGMISTGFIGLKDFLSICNSIKIELFPEKAAQWFIGMKVNTAIVFEVTNDYLNNPNSEKEKAFIKMLEYYGALIGPAADYMHTKINGVKLEKYCAKDSAKRIIDIANAMVKASEAKE